MNKTAMKILNILEESRGEAVSGERIASLVGITRSAVWKNINALKKEGYHILSTNNRGYELVEDNEIFTANRIFNEISLYRGYELATKLDIEVMEEVTSTNLLLKEKARENAPEGSILIAKKQTKGRGRLGRSFFSPKKGVYLSLLLRPKISFRESMLLTTIAAVAVCEAIKEVTGKEAGIKWVNDVYLKDKKVCGILTEAEADVENGSLSFAVVGIGINLTEPEEGLSDDLKEIAGFLYGKEEAGKGIRSALTAAVIRTYFYYYEKLPDHSFMESYRKNQILLNRDIYVIHPNEEKKARVLGVDEEARLMVEYEDGSMENLFTGEVSVRAVEEMEKNKPKFPSLKKKILSLLLLFFGLFLVSCSKSPEPKDLPALSSSSSTEKGYAFKAYGMSFYIGDAIEESLKSFHSPSSKYEAPSCARLGEDVIYTYSGFSLTLHKKEENETGVLSSILLTDDSVTTEEGLFIGEKKERVLEVYGENTLKNGSFTYQKGGMELNFVMKDEVVVSIEYRSLKERGGIQ